jgi:hypothetical protein
MNEQEETYKKLVDDLKNLPRIDAPKNFETELLRKINSSEPEKKQSFWDKLLSPGKLGPAAVAIASAAIIFFIVDISPEEFEDPLNIEPRLREDLLVVESFEDIPFESLKKSERVKDESKVMNEGLDETKEIETQIQQKVGLEERSDVKTKGVEKSFSEESVFDETDMDNLKSEETGGLGMSAAPSSSSTLESEIIKADSFEREMKRAQTEIVNLPVLRSSPKNINKDNIDFMQRNLSVEEKKEVQQLKMKVQSEKSEKNEQKSN